MKPLNKDTPIKRFTITGISIIENRGRSLLNGIRGIPINKRNTKTNIAETSSPYQPGKKLSKVESS